MKKLFTLSAIASSLLLTACGDNNNIPTKIETVDYYVEHSSKAEDAMEDCLKLMPQYREKSRMMDSVWRLYISPETKGEDLKEKFESLANPEEIAEFNGKFEVFKMNCKNVNIAVDIIKENKLQAELKAEEEKVQKQYLAAKETRKENVLNEYKDFNKSYKLDWPEKLEKLRNLEMNSESLRLVKNAINTEISGENFLNEAMYDYVNTPENAPNFNKIKNEWNKYKNSVFAIATFVNTYHDGLNKLSKKSYESLEKLQQEYCSQDTRKFSACYVAKKAEEDIVAKTQKELINDYPKLKTTFNECVTKSADNPMIFNKYPCRQALKALQTRGINFNISEALK